jgi:hypothetical protein
VMTGENRKPREDEWITELWTYAGDTMETGKRRSAWYTPGRDRVLYEPDKKASHIPGCQYATRVARVPGQGGDERTVTWRRTPVTFDSPHPDLEWRAAVEAEAHGHRAAIERAALARRAKADPAVNRVLADLEALAGPMTYAQRDGLIAIVTRKVYRAEPPRTAAARAAAADRQRAAIAAAREEGRRAAEAVIADRDEAPGGEAR